MARPNSGRAEEQPAVLRRASAPPGGWPAADALLLPVSGDRGMAAWSEAAPAMVVASPVGPDPCVALRSLTAPVALECAEEIADIGALAAPTASKSKAERLEVVFDIGDGTEVCVNFVSRPVGLDVTRKLPMRVAGVRGHAKDLGIQPGWQICRLAGVNVCGNGDLDFQKAFRIFAGKAAQLPPHNGRDDIGQEMQDFGSVIETAQSAAAALPSRSASPIVGELAERRAARASWAKSEGRELEAEYSALRRSLKEKLAQKRAVHLSMLADLVDNRSSTPAAPGRSSRAPSSRVAGRYERIQTEAAESERLAAGAGERLLKAFDEWYRKQVSQPALAARACA